MILNSCWGDIGNFFGLLFALLVVLFLIKLGVQYGLKALCAKNESKEKNSSAKKRRERRRRPRKGKKRAEKSRRTKKPRSRGRRTRDVPGENRSQISHSMQRRVSTEGYHPHVGGRRNSETCSRFGEGAGLDESFPTYRYRQERRGQTYVGATDVVLDMPEMERMGYYDPQSHYYDNRSAYSGFNEDNGYIGNSAYDSGGYGTYRNPTSSENPFRASYQPREQPLSDSMYILPQDSSAINAPRHPTPSNFHRERTRPSYSTQNGEEQNHEDINYHNHHNYY